MSNHAIRCRKDEGKLVLMENHSVTVAGGDLYDAYFALGNAEEIAKIFFFSHLKLE